MVWVRSGIAQSESVILVLLGLSPTFDAVDLRVSSSVGWKKIGSYDDVPI